MSGSLEVELIRLDKALRAKAGLPAISGGAQADAGFLVSRIAEVVENWSPGGSSDFTAIASDVKPSADDTYTHGDATHRWKEIHVSDFGAFGDSPATGGLINVPHGKGLTSSQPFDALGINVLKINSSTGFLELGAAAMGLAVQVMGQIGLQVGDDGESTQLSPTGGNVAWSALAPDIMALYSPKATALDTAHSVYGFRLWGNYWDGAATQPTYSGLIQQTNAAGAVETILSAGVYGISEADLHWDKDANLFPDADDTGSLGIAGKRWSEGHFSDFLALGTPASSGQIRLDSLAYIVGRVVGVPDTDAKIIGIDGDNSRLVIGDSDGFQTVDLFQTLRTHIIRLAPVSANTILEGQTFEVTNTQITTLPEVATALSTTKDSGKFVLADTYWDGMAAQYEEVDIDFYVPDPNSPSSVLRYAFYDKDFGTPTLFNVSRALQVYPGVDNTGSLGVAGKTWGDIFATLPTSDPAVAGQFFSFADNSGAGLVANLLTQIAAGNRIVLVSDG